MKLTSQMCSLTCLMPTLWPAWWCDYDGITPPHFR